MREMERWRTCSCGGTVWSSILRDDGKCEGTAKNRCAGGGRPPTGAVPAKPHIRQCSHLRAAMGPADRLYAEIYRPPPGQGIHQGLSPLLCRPGKRRAGLISHGC